MKNLTVIQKLLLAGAGAMLSTLGVVNTAQAASMGVQTTVVAPSELKNVEGNASNGYPLDISDPSLFNGGLTSQRYQQVYRASAFSSLGGMELLITQILFRPDFMFGEAFSSILPDVEIDLSTTSALPNSLSETFAENVGSDNTVVFSGPLALSSANTGPVGGPKDFDIVINLTTPFLYNPVAGNLLLDIKNFGGGTTTVFDAQFPSDPTTRAYSIGANDVNASSGVVDAVGLVTAFKGTPVPSKSVPEPLTIGGTILAGGMGLLMKKKQAAAKKEKETTNV